MSFQEGQLCTFDHYCPNGLHGALASDVNQSLNLGAGSGSVWMPHGDLFNGYVQVGTYEGTDSDHNGKRCFTNPWGHTWGLNKYDTDKICCVYGQ